MKKREIRLKEYANELLVYPIHLYISGTTLFPKNYQERRKLYKRNFKVKGTLEQYYSTDNTINVLNKIFTTFLFDILEEVIITGKPFLIPYTHVGAHIRIEERDFEDIKWLVEMGYPQPLNLYKTGFKSYKVVLSLGMTNNTPDSIIYPTRLLYDTMFAIAEGGFYETIPKPIILKDGGKDKERIKTSIQSVKQISFSYNDIKQRLYDKNPIVQQNSLDNIIKHGFRNLLKLQRKRIPMQFQLREHRKILIHAPLPAPLQYKIAKRYERFRS